MDPADQIEPAFLLLSGIALVFLGLLMLRRTRARRRLVWLLCCWIPAIGLLSIAWLIENRLREDARKSAQIFFSLDPGPDLTQQEATAFQVLAARSPRVREGLMRLAFANSTNAAVALPRLEILLHCAVRFDPAQKEHERLWTKVVGPALRKKPSSEIILLAAATIAIGNYGPARAGLVLQRLLLGSETNSVARAIALGVFVPLVEFAPMDQVERAANLLLQQLLEEQNPARANPSLGSVNPEGSRCIVDLRRVAGRLSQSAARRLGDQALPALASQTNQSRVLALGMVLETMKTQLRPDQLDRAVTNLIQHLPRSRGGVLQERATPLVGLAAVLSPEQAATAVRLLLDCVRQEPDPWWHTELSRPFKTLAQRLSDSEVQRLAESMAAASPDVAETIRDRVPQEQAYLWMDRLLQSIIDTPNPTRRSAQVPRVAPLAARLTPERAGKLVDELWRVFLKDQDELRRWDEAGCLVALAPSLTEEQAMSQAGLIVEQMKEPHSDLRVLAKMLTPLLSRCAPSTAQDAVASIMNRYQQIKLAFGSTWVQQRELLLGAPFTSAQRKLLLEPLVAALESNDDPERCLVWTFALKPLADQLAPDQAERVANRLVFLFTQRLSEISVVSLTSLATNVVLTSDHSTRIVDVILPRALECRMPESDLFARCSGSFLRQLDPTQAEATGQTIIAAMARRYEPMGAVVDAKCLVPLTEALRPDQARRLAEQLLKIPAQRGDHPGFASLMDPSPGPELSLDWRVPAVFIERQEGCRYNYRLRAWSRSLAALMARMEKQDAQIIADQVAERCGDQGRAGPMAFEEQTALVLRQASEAALAGILQTPFAVGGLRRVVVPPLEPVR
jgi:hypothetical protein